MKIAFLPEAFGQYVEWQRQSKTVTEKINHFIEECRRHPFDGTGKPEPLKGDYSGWWSRRIDREHRLVYRADGDTLIIAQCRYHY